MNYLEKLGYTNSNAESGINPPKVLIWVESLVGGGHINNIGAIAHRLATVRGYDVTMVSGSRVNKLPDLEIPGVKFIDLPGLKGEYLTGKTISENGLEIEKDIKWQNDYKTKLLQVYNEVKPDIIGTEFWPIRRGPLDFALIPLMELKEQTKPETLMFSLVRDYVHMSVTNYGSGGDDISAANIFQKYYKENGLLIVHTLKELLPLSASLNPKACDILEPNTHYVGYIIAKYEQETQNNPLKEKVLVTSGSGYTEYCYTTTKAFIETLPNTKFASDNIFVVVPNDTPKEKFDDLKKLSGQYPNINFSFNRKDFSKLMESAKAIFCHGGTTIVEAIDCGIKDIFVTPRMNPGEVIKDEVADKILYNIPDNVHKEQLWRSVIFANTGYIKMLTPEDLDPEKLASKINGHMANEWMLKTSASEICKGSKMATKLIHEAFCKNFPDKASNLPPLGKSIVD